MTKTETETKVNNKKTKTKTEASKQAEEKGLCFFTNSSIKAALIRKEEN